MNPSVITTSLYDSSDINLRERKKGAWRNLFSATVTKVDEVFTRTARPAKKSITSVATATTAQPSPKPSLSSTCVDTPNSSTIVFQECVRSKTSDKFSCKGKNMLPDNQKICEMEEEEKITDSCTSDNSSSRSSTKVKIKKCTSYIKRIIKKAKQRQGRVGGGNTTSSLFWKWTLIVLFIVSVAMSSTSAQGWDRERSRFGRSGNNSKRNSQLCDTSDDNETILGTSCNFEEACQWTWIQPRWNQTGFRNMTSAEIMKKMSKVGEWAFRGPLMDTKNKTDGKNFSLYLFHFFCFVYVYVTLLSIQICN